MTAFDVSDPAVSGARDGLPGGRDGVPGITGPPVPVPLPRSPSRAGLVRNVRVGRQGIYDGTRALDRTSVV